MSTSKTSNDTKTRTYTVSELHEAALQAMTLHWTPEDIAKFLSDKLGLSLKLDNPDLPARIIWDATAGVGVIRFRDPWGVDRGDIIIDLSLHFDREEPMIPEHSARLKRESAILEEAFRCYNAVSEILNTTIRPQIEDPYVLLANILRVLRGEEGKGDPRNS